MSGTSIIAQISMSLNRLNGCMYIIEQSYTTLTKITSVVVAGDGSDKVHARLSEPLISRHYWNRKALRPSKTKVIHRDMYHWIMVLYMSRGMRFPTMWYVRPAKP